MRIPPLSKTYAGRQVLALPELELEAGRIYAVIGANGSGKSTFVRLLAGVIAPDGRKIHLGCSVGYLPQKAFLFRMSTRANILAVRNDSARASELLEALRLKHLEKARADRLSGGEAARLGLARLMMKQFDLVLLDEPSAAMDIEMTILCEEQIQRYVRETGCTLILITHSLGQARRIADEILFFHQGHLTERAPTQELLNQPKEMQTKAFLEFFR